MREYKIVLAQGGTALLPYSLLVLGYEGRRGVDRLRIELRDEWQGLTVRACWHLPDGDPPSSLVKDGVVDIPAIVTATAGDGCITFEGSDGQRTVTSADVPLRILANSGTEDGTTPEPGTPAWEAFLDQVMDRDFDFLVASDDEVTAMLNEVFGAKERKE